MATPLKQWLALMAAGLVLVALWTLPPSRVRLQPSVRLPEQARYDSLDTQVRRDVGVLLATRWSDSLSELTLRTAVDGVAFGAFGVDSATAEPVAAWGHALLEYVRALEPRSEDVVLGVFLQPVGFGQPSGVPGPPVGGTYTYVGVRDGTPYCLQVEPYPFAPTPRELREEVDSLVTGGLGVCTLVAKHRLPGGPVRRWLDEGAFRFGAGTATRGTRLLPTDTWPGNLGPLFGTNRRYIVDANPPAGRCLAGDADACLGVMTSSAQVAARDDSNFAYIAAHSPLTYTTRAAGRVVFGLEDRYLLADLEAEFGADAFARFWTSNLEVPEAFEAAFGEDLGSWVRDWARREVGAHYAGPGFGAGTGLWSLLTLTALAGLACFLGAKRTVA